MEKILYNGKFVTLEDDGIVSALLIRDDRIGALGSLEDVARHTGSDTPRIDMGGKTVIPGIVDGHNHIISAGVAMDGVLLFGAATIDEACDRIREAAKALPKGEWLEGAGWIESQFAENRPIHVTELDKAAPDNPLIISRLFGGALANTKALELAGIGQGSYQPPRGEIQRDAQGRPTGYLKNGAESMVAKVIPRRAGSGDPLARDKKAIIRATQEYIKWGITTILDPGVTLRGMRAFHHTSKAGALPIRVAMMPAWRGLSPDDIESPEVREMVERLGVSEGFGSEFLRFAGLKMAIDGGVGSKTALMNEPWRDGSVTTIPTRLDLGKLDGYFNEGHKAGWSIGIHCCGDQAQDIALRSFDKTIKKYGGNHRHHIIHGYFPTEEALEIMARQDIGVSVQPGFMYIEGDIYENNLEREKVNTFTPLKTYIKNGIRVFANSDMTSNYYNPFYGIASAVNRLTSQGKQLGADECISVEDALLLFIKNGAYYCGLEDVVGSLKVGKQADLAVLDRDILSVPSREIMDIKVLSTYIAGKEVYGA